MADEGLREIQLDGKQLVFLFMAATVVAVVIFLCGVMVGRGVPAAAERLPEDGLSAIDPTESTASLESAPIGGSSAGPTAPADVVYDDLLTAPDSSNDTLRPASESAPEVTSEPEARVSAVSAVPPKPAVTTATAVAVPSKPAVTTAKAVAVAVAPRGAATGASGFTEPKGRGYVVQVAALPSRDEATTLARGLSSKGYPVFVTTSGSNFRVRVGKYSKRGEAEAVANRLEREERFQTWVTR